MQFSPSISVCFMYPGSKHPVLNQLWLKDLMTTANAASGLGIVPEPIEPLA